MTLADLGKIVVKYGAPLLGTALGGTGGGLIGKLIADYFGGDIKDIDDLINKISLDPDKEIKLKQIESNERIELERLITLDKQSARQRETEFIKATGTKDYTLKNLAYITVIGFFGVLFTLFMQHIDINETEKQLLAVLIGMLASKFQTIIDYYFGASREREWNK
jgi:hypothetical protein